MRLSPAESLAVSEIAQQLYSFLPGTPHPYADQDLSFPGAARKVGVADLWRGGSKLPAITRLLDQTLETRRDLFCPLILEIVRRGLSYRANKGDPVTRDEMRWLNELLTRVHFKIPEFWDPAFLDNLPSARSEPAPDTHTDKAAGLSRLKDALIKLDDLSPQNRGLAFEPFLQDLFSFYDLAPRKPFRLVGEQIDGSFELGGDVYLVEAKWHQQQIGTQELYVFREKVEGKSTWSRGLMVSYSGFTGEGLDAFSRGRATNMIGMSGQDIFAILEGEMSLVDAIRSKIRRAAETGEFFIPVFELSRM